MSSSSGSSTSASATTPATAAGPTSTAANSTVVAAAPPAAAPATVTTPSTSTSTSVSDIALSLIDKIKKKHAASSSASAAAAAAAAAANATTAAATSGSTGNSTSIASPTREAALASGSSSSLSSLSTPATTTTTSSQATSGNDTASNSAPPVSPTSSPHQLLSNLAISFHKNLSSAKKRASGKEAKEAAKRLVIIDDDYAFDDDEVTIERQMNASSSSSSSASSATPQSAAGADTAAGSSCSSSKISSSRSVMSQLSKKAHVKMSSTTNDLSRMALANNFNNNNGIKMSQIEESQRNAAAAAAAAAPSSSFKKSSSYTSLPANGSLPPSESNMSLTAADSSTLVDDMEDAAASRSSSAPPSPPPRKKSPPPATTTTTTATSALFSPFAQCFALLFAMRGTNKAWAALAVAGVAIALTVPSQLLVYMFVYWSGLATGAALIFLVFYVLIKLDFLKHIIASNSTTTATSANTASQADQMTDQMSLAVTTASRRFAKNFDGVYKGWMNELREPYDPQTYVLNKTRSVFVSVDGHRLRVQTTTSRVPKRVVFNEHAAHTEHNVAFSEQRIYDLSDAEVHLMPERLCRKRYWSKKYPMCLRGLKLLRLLQQQKTIENANADNSDDALNTSTSGKSPSSSAAAVATKQLESDTLILFARTDREKEDWFCLFARASHRQLPDSRTYRATQHAKIRQQQQQLLAMATSPSLDSVALIASSSVLAAQYDHQQLFNRTASTTSSSSSSTATATATAAASSSEQHAERSSMNSTTSGSTSNLATASTTDLSTTGLDGASAAAAAAAAAADIWPPPLPHTASSEPTLVFLNALLSRLTIEIFTKPIYCQRIQTKIQNKLAKLNLPTIMEDLKIIGIDLGSALPVIKQTGETWYDDKGLWAHFDLEYNGGFQVTLATKINLMRLKVASNSQLHTPSTPTSGLAAGVGVSFNVAAAASNYDSSDSLNISGTTPPSATSMPTTSAINENNNNNNNNATSASNVDPLPCFLTNPNQRRGYIRHMAIVDSAEEESPESSGDEYAYDDETSGGKSAETSNASKKLLNIVTKITASNVFQKATDNRFIKMALENVSSSQLSLSVEVRKVAGTLAINIPPHASDRIWYGFATNPEINLVTKPQVGEKEVSYSAVSDWIAEKIKKELQKVIVYPNMDDFYLAPLTCQVASNANK